ncbi:MAG: hypothetical protein E7376_01895 [Clostridiales bacterium]|nr:hypothetical protein [Clostridiales bacterium]
MEEKQETIVSNYNVYNALNLYNEELGQSYIETGFNPLGENFVLGEEFITDVLKNNKDAKDFSSPEFIEKGDKATKAAFENSLAACEALLNELTGKLNSAELSPNDKAKLQKIILYLQMRIQLLKIFIAKLKKEKNKLKMYQSLLALNWSLADLMEETFNEMCNVQTLANAFVVLEQNTNIQAEQENAKLREQARQIIANNLKAQFQSQKQQTESTNPYMQELNNIQKEIQEPVKEVIEKPKAQTEQKQENKTFKEIDFER